MGESAGARVSVLAVKGSLSTEGAGDGVLAQLGVRLGEMRGAVLRAPGSARARKLN